MFRKCVNIKYAPISEVCTFDNGVIRKFKFTGAFKALLKFNGCKVRGFLIFSGGIERDQWLEMG